MRPKIILKHEFVESVPEQLLDGIIYVSIRFASVIHKCCCGCGKEVVTPLSPRDWQLIFDGHSISLYPSIGNWNFPCQSHYWIKQNIVEWAPRWSKEKIEAARAYSLTKDCFNKTEVPRNNESDRKRKDGKLNDNFWIKLKDWLLL